MAGGGLGDGRAGESRSWLLIKHRDDWAGEVDITEFAPRSVKSDGDFEDILADDKPDVWESHRPAEGGVAGNVFHGVTFLLRCISCRMALLWSCIC